MKPYPRTTVACLKIVSNHSITRNHTFSDHSNIAQIVRVISEGEAQLKTEDMDRYKITHSITFPCERFGNNQWQM